MRGYLQFLEGDRKMRGDEKLAKIEQALSLMSRPEEKRSAIAVVQSVPSAASLELLEKLATDPAMSEDASLAIIELAGKNQRGISTESRRTALQTISEKSTSEDVKQRAKAALAKIH